MNTYKNHARIFMSFCQALIDAMIYSFSFGLAISFWLDGKTPSAFTQEVRLFFTGTMLAVFYFNSLYSFKTWPLWDEMKAIIKSSLLIFLVTVLYLYSQGFDISRFTLATGTIIFMPLCAFSRWVFRRTCFALGLMSTNIIILGAGRTGTIFADKIKNHPFTMGKITGFLDDDDSKQGLNVAGYPVRGKLDDFTKIYEAERIDEAAVAISAASRRLLTHILDIVEFHVRQVHYIPDMYLLTTFSSAMKDVDGVPVIAVSQGLTSPYGAAVKALADYAGALMAIIILSPVMLWTSVKVKLTHGGEIFSRQERVGLNGKSFFMLKFRSSGGGKTSKVLRQSYIDEIPQFFNVLKGEMSLVGPKAFTHSDMLHVYGADISQKVCMVKPGITGFWQISDHEKDKRICGEMNLYYIRNWSLWLDAVILLRTIIKIFPCKRT